MKSIATAARRPAVAAVSGVVAAAPVGSSMLATGDLSMVLSHFNEGGGDGTRCATA